MKVGSPQDPPRPLIAHLDELRLCLLRMLLAWGVCTLLVLPLAPLILGALTHPLAIGTDAAPEIILRAIRVGSGMRVLMQITFWGGLGLSLPLMIGLVARFVFPGLTLTERRLVLRLTLLAGALFLLGVVLGYHLTLGLAIRFLIGLNAWLGVTMDWVELSDYVAFAMRVLLAFGLAFELPVLLLGLGYAGLIDSATLRRHRRSVLVGTFVAGMILTPPDPFSQTLMALPLYGLYEMCVWLLRLREHRT